MRRCLNCRETFDVDGWLCPRCGASPRSVDGLATFVPPGDDADEGYPIDVAMPDAAQENFWRVARNRLYSWALSRWFPEARSFLEVGCGTGGVLRALGQAHPELRLVGAERDRQMAVLAARSLPGVEIIRADARDVPYRSAFDVVGSFDVIEHIDDDRGATRALHDAARPGSGVLVSVPQHPWLWSERDARLHHQRRYTRALLRERLAEAGLELVHTTSFMSLPLPLMAVSALRNQRARAAFDPHAELKHGAWVDGPMGALLSAERALLKTGVSLPAGGSLLAVARRPE